MTLETPDLTGLRTHERTAVPAEWVRAIAEARARGTHKVPPRAVFRNNAAGRRAWLDQAERSLRADIGG